MGTVMAYGEMRQRAFSLLEGIYQHCITVVDGIAQGKWTVADWNDVDHNPPVSTLDELIMVSHTGLTSAWALCQELGILTRTETAEIDKRYREQRPDIFWPYVRHGWRVHPKPPVA